tara:strand:+ start:2434 stop:2637 length:204 start_codon:yes stop_codon:yes gene_type:complete
MAIDKHIQEEIQRLYQLGYGYGSISRKLNVSKSTARRYAGGIRQINGKEVRKDGGEEKMRKWGREDL